VHIRNQKLQKLARARAKADQPAESPNPAIAAELATSADTSSSADFPLATALLTTEAANPKLIARILALPALQGLGDAQVAWCLRAARKPHQQGPGLYLFTLPELVARQRLAAGEKAQMPIVFEPICKACNDLGFVPANGEPQEAGETVDAYLDRCRKCGCATAAGMAENAATLARVASEGGGRNVTKGATR
jgi:hypothetical protein